MDSPDSDSDDWCCLKKMDNQPGLEKPKSEFMVECTRILIAASEPVRRAAAFQLQAVSDLQVVGQAQDVGALLSLSQQLQPDVVVLEMDLLATGSLSAIDEIRRILPDGELLILTEGDQEERAVEAFRHGVYGHLNVSEAGLASLAEAIRSVRRREAVLNPRLAGRILDEITSIRTGRRSQS